MHQKKAPLERGFCIRGDSVVAELKFLDYFKNRPVLCREEQHGLCGVIESFYPKDKGAGRPTISVESMLRIHFLQHRFYLSDIAVEEACN